MPTTKRKTKKPTDAIALLKTDHVKVRGLLKKLESAAGKNPGKARDLVAQIDQELKVHTQIEEEIFYPAFKEAARNKKDKEMFYEANEEHHVVDLVMPDVKKANPEGAGFAAKAKVLKELVEHHADEEEKEMFPKARKLMGLGELRELGARLEQRKGELQGKS
jgi:hemerythrin superfamily protein